MKVFSDIGSKFIWLIIVVLAVGFGYVFVLRNFLNPPPATVSPVSPSSSPVQALSPAPSPDSVAINSNTGEPSPTLVPDNENSSNVDDVSSSTTSTTDTESSPMPALALPDEVALKVPQKLEKGGVLKIYDNNDGNENPDPVMYSPTKVVQTKGMSVIELDRGQFQEVSGYFLVKDTGTYNFTVGPSLVPYLRLSDLRTRIDGSTLPNVKGGRVALEEGWHQVSLFVNTSNVTALSLSWGREGETLKPLAVWRETK